MDKKEPVSERETRRQLLGKLLKRERDDKGFSQETLAEKVGITPAYLSQIESGSITLAPSLLFKFASVLGTSVSQMILDVESLQGMGNTTKRFIPFIRMVERRIEKYPNDSTLFSVFEFLENKKLKR